ncbi:TPA: hypothetical protein ACH3X1_010122 [Trebouxia sp. C0004]
MVRGGCELKDSAKPTSVSEAGFKRGRGQATSRGKLSTQGHNSMLTLGAHGKMRQASDLFLLREDNVDIGYPYREYKFQLHWATQLIVSLMCDADNLPVKDLALSTLKK